MSNFEATFDPMIPASKQMVTYQTKDGQTKTVSKAELQEQLESREKLMESLNETWEQKMARTQEIQKEREQALEELGITVEKNHVGVHTPKRVRLHSTCSSVPHSVNTAQMPHLVNLVSLESQLHHMTLNSTCFLAAQNEGECSSLSGLLLLQAS